MKTILKNLKACDKAIEWVEDKTIEEAVNECPRGDWTLWLAQGLKADVRLITLAKGHCANTVRHLMKDKRSIKAVDTAIAFGSGEATIEELMDAHGGAASAASAYDASCAYDSVAFSAASAARASTSYAASAYASASYAASVSACADAADASTSYAASAYASASYAASVSACADAADASAASASRASTSYAASAYAASNKENQLLTANICREHLGQFIIDKCKSLKTHKNESNT